MRSTDGTRACPACLGCRLPPCCAVAVGVAPCRRVVAVGVDPHSTAASDVMTHNPTTVLTEDSAMEALGVMLGRHFRHLPVRRDAAECISAEINCSSQLENSILRVVFQVR